LSKVLFIGGTGIISSACAAQAIERGMDLTLVTRGLSIRPPPKGARHIKSDGYKLPAVLRRERFDSVVNWIAYRPDHIETDIDFFRGRINQYVFISSASVYQAPPPALPITEEMPLDNPCWRYARDKIECEMRLRQSTGFPWTIVRPSHTYDRTLIPIRGRYTVIDRMRRGASVVVHGDGTSLWVLTHHSDFALGLVGLLGRSETYGEAYHITSDECLTWNEIYLLLGRAAGVEPALVHLPSEVIAAYASDWGESLLGDKAHSKIFDNSKVKKIVPEYRAVVPFARGAEEIVAWYDADSRRRAVDAAFDRLLDDLVAAHRRSMGRAPAPGD